MHVPVLHVWAYYLFIWLYWLDFTYIFKTAQIQDTGAFLICCWYHCVFMASILNDLNWRNPSSMSVIFREKNWRKAISRFSFAYFQSQPAPFSGALDKPWLFHLPCIWKSKSTFRIEQIVCPECSVFRSIHWWQRWDLNKTSDFESKITRGK